MTGLLDTYVPPRPKTRGDCVNGERPCPWAGCRHHLLLDVRAGGRLEMYAEEPDQLEETCSLDVADRGGVSERAIVVLLGRVTTRQAVNQIVQTACAKMTSPETRELLAFVHAPHSLDVSDWESDDLVERSGR